FLEGSEEVTYTVVAHEDVDVWESVVATGTIRPLGGETIADGFVPVFFARGEGGDRRWVDIDEQERKWYEIRLTDVSGRHSGRPSGDE
ncbi:MAG: hypothetical protein V5A46_10685, partial [Haloferacaceae archaeon]